MPNPPESNRTNDDIMTIAGARQFRRNTTCFVGVGLPGAAACVAKAIHKEEIVLVYESGAVGAKPTVPPLSIADWELAETADAVIGIPELFAYWIQGGRIDMALLGAAQMDRFGNLNTTVIGSYSKPKVRLPGAGGAPEIASGAKEIVIMVRHTARVFVETVDFVTTSGRRRNIKTVVTDLGILKPDAETGELTLTSLHPGVALDEVRRCTSWKLKIADDLVETPEPTPEELQALRTVKICHKKAQNSQKADLLTSRNSG